jgi:hypothetical protein
MRQTVQALLAAMEKSLGKGFLSSALHETAEENEPGSGRHRAGMNERNPSQWGAQAEAAGDQDPARIAADHRKGKQKSATETRHFAQEPD